MALNESIVDTRDQGCQRRRLTPAHGFCACDEIPIVWDVVGEQCPVPFNIVAPITVQFAGHSNPVHQLNSCSTHASQSGMSSDFIEGTRSIRDIKHFITSLNSGKSRECHTDFSDHTNDDQLLAASAANRLNTFFMIPSIDVPRSGNLGGIREQLLQFRHQGTVGSILKAGRQNRWKIKVFCAGPQSKSIILEFTRGKVLNPADQSRLVID